MPRILYISFDGILEPLGHSQILRVLEGLARRGHPYVLLSLERRKDLSDVDRVRACREQLAESGIDWIVLPFESGSARSAAENIARALTAAARVCVTRGVRLVHARSYQAGLIALALNAALRVPFLFDARGYWIDERLDEGRWFTNPKALAAARAVERRLFTRSSAVVTLTELQAEDVRRGRFGRPRGPVLTIPTCADFHDFRIREPDYARLPEAIAARLSGKLVIGFVGSVNVSYLLEESLRLARFVLELRPDAHFLVLTRQLDVFREHARAAALDEARTTILTVSHDSMPSWSNIIDWGLLLLRSSAAKRASMPTKLAEFFASGVRPIFHGCNTEVADWVNAAGSGVVLPSVDEDALRQAAQAIANVRSDGPELLRARELAEPHFSLDSGVERYDRLLKSIL